MITSKKLSAIVAVALCACLAFCGLIVYANYAIESKKAPEYEKRLFGDEILTIDIQVDKDDWQGLLDNAQAKEWVSGDLVINGERFSAVGLRTKGNSSLTQMGRSGSGRYSLQFSANKYVKGQTFYGLDTFCVNNLMGDATYMKDYLAYEIMEYIGVAAPLRNYAKVTVNGEDYGFCVALERYDKAFLDRVYDTSGGQLYNVKISMGGRGDFEDMFQENPQARSRGGGGMGGFGRGNGGGSLLYTDDDPASYSAIFDNAVFKSSDKDKQRVIEALNNLNAGTDLEKYFDVDGILRYFAAHTVVVNSDSYTSNMQQNYYLYERDGKITILPWDYGLAFGGFQSGNVSSVVNFPIDTPVSGVSMEDRPLLNKLLEVDEYRERYHGYLRDIAEGYLQSGKWENTINALDAKINGYVKTDSSAYFTYDQYKAALPVLAELGLLRAESILGQLDGTVPSTTTGQRAEDAVLVDSSGINLSALGSMMGGGGMGGGDRGQGGDWGQGGGRGQGAGGRERPGRQNEEPGEPPDQAGGFGEMPEGGLNPPDGFEGGMPGFGGGDMGAMGQAMQILMAAGGELTEELKAQLLELGITEEQMEMFTNMQGMIGGRGGFPGMGGDNSSESSGGRMPGGMDMGGMPGGTANSTNDTIGYVVMVGVLLVLLAGAMMFIIKPRKNMI